MTSADTTHHIPGNVRAAIHAFLNTRQKENKLFAASDALDAVRRVFPDLEISDTDLVDAITSEASTAGFDFEADTGSRSDPMKWKSLDRWNNEGGAIDRCPRTEAQRMIDNDTSGSRRRAKETKTRNDLI